jgi:hypothetical protein
MASIDKLKHPQYLESESDWLKWRLTYESGDDFLKEYLKKFSSREDAAEFAVRQQISYVPAFAQAAVDEVKDAIFQRISDVSRPGGHPSYTSAVKGLGRGVDLGGSSMNSFIGRIVLTEMLPMKRVGVFVDMPDDVGPSLYDQQDTHPYLYHYKTEDILNWEKSPKENTFTRLLLRDYTYEMDEEFNLPVGVTQTYRYLRVVDDVTVISFTDEKGEQIKEDKVLDVPEIPFVMFEIPHSLLKNIANYQIALLNLASSDIAYSLKANFPFYIEQFDPRLDNFYSRPATKDPSATNEAGERADSQASKAFETTVGTTTGRRYPRDLDAPSFIHPSSEPLLASMQKQDELKRDIRMLVKLNIANLSPKMASGESKSFDERSLEAGLSAIGLELQHGERQVAKYWQTYMDQGQEAPKVEYPSKYGLQTDKDKREEAKDLQESTKGHPSVTYKKEVYKLTSDMNIGTKISNTTSEKIHAEIDAAPVIVSDPEELNRDVELTLLDPETASLAKGYPEGTVDKANEAHAARVTRIAESQGQARGVPDLGGLANASRSEKIDKDGEETAELKTRGEEDDA